MLETKVYRPTVLQRGDGTSNVRREVRSDVEHGVPLASLEGGEIRRPVASQLLHVREELRVRLSAVEERRLVARFEQSVHERSPQEPRPAEDECSHPG